MVRKKPVDKSAENVSLDKIEKAHRERNETLAGDLTTLVNDLEKAMDLLAVTGELANKQKRKTVTETRHLSALREAYKSIKSAHQRVQTAATFYAERD